MRRRRGNRSTWFPILPTQYQEEGFPGVTWYEQTLTINNASAGDTSVIAIPLTFDTTTSPDEIDPSQGYSLADFVQGQDYLVERVCGQVWFSGALLEQEAAGVEFIGCIALAVLPAGTGSSPELSPEEYNPLFAKNAQQPWMWRRTWRLSSPWLWTEGQNGRNHPSVSTWYAGGNSDAGNLDCKVKRRVTREHKLYLIGAVGILTSAVSGNPSVYQFGYDLRLLGQMRRGRNKSSF